MIKQILVASATTLLAAPAMAGQYANVEANSSFEGGEYGSTRIDTHYGYENDLGENSKYYVQGGPSMVSRNGKGLEQQVGGKVGIETELTEDLTSYGEVTGYSSKDWDLSDIDVSVKAGLTYRF